MAAVEPLTLLASAFRAAASAPSADVQALGEEDLGVPAEVERLLSACPGALEALPYADAAEARLELLPSGSLVRLRGMARPSRPPRPSFSS